MHPAFLGFLVLALVWNLVATARPAEEGRRRPTWERLVLLPLQLLLTAVLILDRRSGEPSLLLQHTWLAHLFPLLFLGALAQNLHCLLSRGARLTDIPLILFNVGVGAALMVADLALIGVPLGQRSAALLYDHAVLQGLLGTRLHMLFTLSWHLPLFCRRGAVTGLVDGALMLVPVSVAAFGALLLTIFATTAGGVLASFDEEPRVASLPADLAVAVVDRPGSLAAPGDWTAWRVPLDAVDTLEVPTRPRPLLVELIAPAAWYADPPDPDTAQEAFRAGALAAARRLTPDLLLPFPEPDGAGTLWFAPETDWRDLFEGLRLELGEATPPLALRLANSDRRSQRILQEVLIAPAVVDVVGPTLAPAGGGAADVGAAHADRILEVWREWLGPADQRPAALWILGAGLSPLAYGEAAQERFLEGCLARAAAAGDVAGVLVQCWRDDRHTLSVLRPDGSPRWAGRRLLELLPPGPGR